MCLLVRTVCGFYFSAMSEPLRIGIIMASTRRGRFSERPAEWLLGVAQKREDVAVEVVDLRDYPLPFFDEPKSPMREASKHPVAMRWAEKVAALDAFIFVTGEYNHGIPASLKNALDYVYAEFNRKAAAFVGYGNAGGARAIEQLRLILVELQIAPLRSALHMAGREYLDMVLNGKMFADFPHLEAAAATVLDDVIWWGKALRAARCAL